MVFTNSWDSTTPAGSANANTIDDHIRALKVDIFERFGTEHVITSGAAAATEGQHTDINCTSLTSTGDIKTDNSGAATMIVDAGVGTNPTVELQEAGVSKWKIANDQSSDDLSYANAAANEVMQLLQSGGLEIIGDATLGYIRIKGGANSSAYMDVMGIGTGDAYVRFYSDAAVKWEFRSDSAAADLLLKAGAATKITFTATGVTFVDAITASGGVVGDITGDVTGNLTGSASAIDDGVVSTTAKIANSVVTLAKMENCSQGKIYGRQAGGGTGAPEQLSSTEARAVLNVEDGSTADQTGAEIKSAYEGEADTNAYDDAAVTTLSTALQTTDNVVGDLKPYVFRFQGSHVSSWEKQPSGWTRSFLVITHNLGTLDYTVICMAYQDTASDHTNVFMSAKTTNNFTLECDGDTDNPVIHGLLYLDTQT